MPISQREYRLDTLRYAQNDWAWTEHAKGAMLSGDSLIALAFGCKRATRREAAHDVLTAEDAAILARRGKGWLTDEGDLRHYPNDRVSLAYLMNLNA